MADPKPVSYDEAREILSRFNASHWNNPTEHARYSIPARPDHDDDCRLAAYIDQNRNRDALLLAFLRHLEIEVLPCEYIDPAVAPDGIAERAAELVRLLDPARPAPEVSRG